MLVPARGDKPVGVVVRLDERPVRGLGPAGGAHVVGIRRPDGTLSGPYAATRIDDYRLSISGIDFEPDTSWSIEPPHLLFGPLNRWSYPALITSISPSGTDGASVQAVNYAPEVYTYDNATPA